VVVLSRGSFYQYLIRQIAPPEKMRLIHNWVDPIEHAPDTMPPEILVARGWDASMCNVIAIGRLADQKRFDWLLRTWKIVISKVANARLWIIGDGPERSDLERLETHLELRKTCVFLGAHPEARSFIAAADFIAMTSLYEGHALIPLEAMACGKAIVASDVDGVNDSLTDGVEGFLVPPGHVEMFADRILQLVGDAELRSAMGARGRQRVEQFSSNRGYAEYRALINEVLAEPPVR
jgi:glycosyltransferase involved in cell wall biosynthesis